MTEARAPERYDDVTVLRRAAVAQVVLDRPAARNAISTSFAKAIAAAFAALAADDGVRAVVLSSSATGAFCVGADLKERATFSDEDLLAQRPVMRAAFDSVRELPQPVIAAVTGYALGGGAELALSCDLVVADDTAVLGLPEVTVGLVPGGGGTQLLARRIGYNRAADLIFTGRRIGAADALAMGLVDRVVPAAAAVDVATRIASRIAANSPVGVRAAKRALAAAAGGTRAGLDAEDAEWRAVAVSADRREGIAAFNEKREPVWPGG